MQCFGSLTTFAGYKITFNNMFSLELFCDFQTNVDISVKHGSCSCWPQKHAKGYVCTTTIITMCKPLSYTIYKKMSVGENFCSFSLNHESFPMNYGLVDQQYTVLPRITAGLV